MRYILYFYMSFAIRVIHRTGDVSMLRCEIDMNTLHFT
jgi:hypothetical protein